MWSVLAIGLNCVAGAKTKYGTRMLHGSRVEGKRVASSCGVPLQLFLSLVAFLGITSLPPAWPAIITLSYPIRIDLEFGMSLSPRSNEASSSSRSTTELTSPPPAGKKGKLSAHEKQAQAISKLLAKPDKEIRIPEGPKEKTIRPPRDVMKNVTGSSAGAGSGEFHVYKQQRRREYQRIQLMEEQNKKVGHSLLFSQTHPMCKFKIADCLLCLTHSNSSPNKKSLIGSAPKPSDATRPRRTRTVPSVRKRSLLP